MGSPMTPIQVVDSERQITLKESEISYLRGVLNGGLIVSAEAANPILLKFDQPTKN